VTEISPSNALAELLRRYESLNGIVNYAFFLPEVSASRQEAHRAAALAFAKTFTPIYLDPSLAPPDASRVEAEKAVGVPIGLHDFFGSRYDWENQRLVIRAGSAGDDEGYAYAFGDSPWGGIGPEAAVAELFAAINQELFGDDLQDMEIVRWSNDWASYFDDGREWWGAFLWTVIPNRRPYVVAIGASTTD
jgi:hypothetical protein